MCDSPSQSFEAKVEPLCKDSQYMTILNTGDEEKISKTMQDGSNSGFSALRLKDKIAILTTAVAIFTFSNRVALPAPFFPQEALKKSASASVVGVIFGIFEFTIFLTSPIFGKLIATVGPQRLILVGLVTSGLATISFGFLYLSPAGYPFITLALITRTIDALGSSAFAVSTLNVLTHFFPNRYALTYAAVACIGSLGNMSGPVIGSALFELGGFLLPFLVLGVTTLAYCPVFAFTLSDFQATSPANGNEQIDSSSSAFRFGTSNLVWTGLLGLFMAAVGNLYLAPSLATHLESFGLEPIFIGLCFSVAPVIYAVSTPVLGFFADKWDIKWHLQLYGTFGFCIVYVLLGPSPLMPFLTRSIWVVLIGLMILGLSEAGLTVPSPKFVLQGIKEQGFETDVRTIGIISGLNVGAYHSGAFVGPLLGGAFTEAFGFAVGATLLAGIYLCAFIVFLVILCYRLCLQKREITYGKREKQLLLQNEVTIYNQTSTIHVENKSID